MSNIKPTPDAAAARDASTKGARLLILLLALAWGLNWIASRYTLDQLTPWGSRFLSLGAGTAVLFTIALVTDRALRVPRRQWLSVAIAGFFNVAAFNIFNASAQTTGMTARAVVIAYSMPIWTAFLARVVLGEAFTTARVIALLLCAGGLAVLIWPEAHQGLPIAAAYALGCALSWSAGTIFVKWASLDLEPVALAAWQLLVGWLMIAAGTLVLEGLPQVSALTGRTWLALAYNAVIGFGLAYWLWFVIVERLAAMTATLGSLLAPVVSVIAATIILGERPTAFDFIGFVMIFAAAICVLLRPNEERNT